MELKGYNIEEELSSIRFSCGDEAIGEIKNLFFHDQLEEEEILGEIYSPNTNEITKVDLNRLNIDRVFSKRQIVNKYLLKRCRFVDSFKYQEDYPVQTILDIKSEQRRLKTKFRSYSILLTGSKFRKQKDEPVLFAKVGDNIYYLLNDTLFDEKISSKFNLKNFFNWIKKKISIKTFSKS